MNRLHVSFVWCLCLLLLAPSRSSADRAQSDNSRLTLEQLQVYGDFIESMSKAHFSLLSNRTFPLDLTNLPKDSTCLHDIDLESSEAARKGAHPLGPEVLRGKAIRLVGQGEESVIMRQRDAGGTNSRRDSSGMMEDLGILALSEIVFDKTHHFAVVKYVFICGSRCNSGAILVLEKVGSSWSSATRRPCSWAPTTDKPRS
jgi:hypothetical protein